MVLFRNIVAASLLSLIHTTGAHGSGQNGSSGMPETSGGRHHGDGGAASLAQYLLPSYAGLEKHSSMMTVHIVLMVLAWFFILPLGVMFSIGRSRYALPVQFIFLALNGIGVIAGTIYNFSTPDLYENNAHHKIGWIATWVVTAQVLMSLLFMYTGRAKPKIPRASETARFLPISTENMAGFTASPVSPYHDYRWSGEIAHGAERSFSGTTQNSRDISPTDAHRFPKEEPARSDVESEDGEGLPMPAPGTQRQGVFPMRRLHSFLSKRKPGTTSRKLLKTTETMYEVIDRTILILGFITLSSGGVTYFGIFRGSNAFNGMAHFVKGGIFFWYGLLTLGKWMGCFADFGWAWNIKPSRSEVGQWQACIPSCEFAESFLIWLYGFMDVFMEHMAAWGSDWVAQDLEHVSISIMFFGGGLCGMLIESHTVRQWLNTNVDLMPSSTDVHPSQAQQVRRKPIQYGHSMNPMPALIIGLLGIMMSAHHQDSMVSTTVHKQWGTLLLGAAFARGVTYIITYLSPPNSVNPSRPPSELIAAFCLICGGLTFMASNKDIVHYMEEKNLMAMFTLTVTVGFTALVMAYEIIVIALKGWAVRKERAIATMK